jgi:16S rRNA (cytosine1402-N4)-methyltransferase
MHTPVLLNQVIDNLGVKEGGLYIDATYGEGGHSREILKQGGKVLAFEWDKHNYELKSTSDELKKQKITLVNENFINIKNIAEKEGFSQVDGILFDFGLSMEQIARSGKGFSYRKVHEPLDMRIGNADRTAADILNEYDQLALEQTFIKNAEEIRSHELAQAIIRKRSAKAFEYVSDIVEVVEGLTHNIHESEPMLRRIFQALRIEVNDEFKNLDKAIWDSYKLLKPGGRLLVISFHSLEDRMVKQILNKQKKEYRLLKPIRSKSNFAFERSATLRVAIKNI